MIEDHQAVLAVAISAAEEALGEVRVRAGAGQAERLLAWAAAWPQRTWAVEGAGGMGHLVAQQLLSAGERVLDVQPNLGARVRLLAAGDTNKNDPNDARSVAIAARCARSVRGARLNSVDSRPGVGPADCGWFVQEGARDPDREFGPASGASSPGADMRQGCSASWSPAPGHSCTRRR